MKRIWKYELEITDKQIISIPSVLKILSLQTQRGVPCLWVEIDDEFIKRDVTIVMFGTGHQMDTIERCFVGTFQTMNGSLVFHVYWEN